MLSATPSGNTEASDATPSGDATGSNDNPQSQPTEQKEQTVNADLIPTPQRDKKPRKKRPQKQKTLIY
jgi:hypothetical protein